MNDEFHVTCGKRRCELMILQVAFLCGVIKWMVFLCVFDLDAIGIIFSLA